MSKRRIDPVSDRYDKQRTYNQQLGRHSKAMREEFYFEALLIDYAVIEDRLKSMIYHMGFLANRTAAGIWKKTRPYLIDIISTYKMDSENETLGISNISGKIKIIRAVLKWANNSTIDTNDKFLATLSQQCNKLDIDAWNTVLDDIVDWCHYRNEVIHALMNKNIESLELELNNKAEQGLQLARFLDSQVKILKKGNTIRKVMNLPIR